MKNKTKCIIAAVIAIIFLIILIKTFFLMGKNQEIITINGNKINTEVVSDSQKMELGLGGRSSLANGAGMLFVFPTSAGHPFWMKGMKFDLDIIWINDGKIVHIEKNVKADFAGILSPAEPSDHVLEIAAGSADKIGMKEGDMVQGY